MFDKILIATRGEAAARISRTCERRGVTSVAIHTDADQDSMHAQVCDHAVRIEASEGDDPYLDHEAILGIARAQQVQAIHPGYGRLSEDAAFARKVREAGLTFIGPGAELLHTMGERLSAYDVARRAGIRALAHSPAVSDFATARARATELGYPLVVKASRKSDGACSEVVQAEDELEQALSSVTEQQRSAADGEAYLERVIPNARQIEVQLAADHKGDCAALGERECSIQRMHEKLLEESPTPLLAGVQGDKKRDTLLDAAVRFGREASYSNLGTAKFLLDADNQLHFFEFCTRLQAEHPVTEMCTSLDLVDLQLSLACGEPLPSHVKLLQPSGHAMQARVMAEDPSARFAPVSGEISRAYWPSVAPGQLRVETAIRPGMTIGQHSDHLLAKIVAYGPTRHQALLTLDRVLAETVIAPIKTNLGFLREILADESFRAGQYDCTLADLLARRAYKA